MKKLRALFLTLALAVSLVATASAATVNHENFTLDLGGKQVQKEIISLMEVVDADTDEKVAVSKEVDAVHMRVGDLITYSNLSSDYYYVKILYMTRGPGKDGFDKSYLMDSGALGIDETGHFSWAVCDPISLHGYLSGIYNLAECEYLLCVAVTNFDCDNGENTTLSETYVLLDGFFGATEPEPTPEPEPEKPAIPATGTAYALEQTAVLDGREIDFDTYALKDENGNGTNYMKIRDLAYVLNGSAAQFALGYDAGSISFTSKTAYTTTGTEMAVPFTGDQTYSVTPGTFLVDGKEVKMTTVSILDAAGNGYTYIKVRDLAEALNFYVGWNGKIVIDTGRPYEA